MTGSQRIAVTVRFISVDNCVRKVMLCYYYKCFLELRKTWLKDVSYGNIL